MRNNLRSALLCGLPLILGAVLLACTGEAPEIRQVFWQLNVTYDPGANSQYEALSVFVHVVDADGIEDVDLFYILQDEHELLWELDAEGWRTFENDGETWIGSNNIRMNDGSVFPRAPYRLIVIDRAGERASDKLYINADEVDVGLDAFPRAVVSEERITLEGDFPEFTLSFYDREWNQVKIFTSNERNLPISSALNVRERQVVRYVYIHTLNERGGYGFVYGPVPLM